MKAIGWLIGILLLVVVGLGVYVVMNSGSLIKTAVETLGPKVPGCRCAARLCGDLADGGNG